MIYALKLLFAALLACWATAALCRRPFRDVLPAVAYRHAWQLVALTTAAAYLCNFAALYYVVFAGIAIYGRAKCANQAVAPISIYLLLAVVAPPLTFGIGGIAGISNLILIDQYRMLALVVLMPAAIRLALRHRTAETGGIRILDAWIIAYIVLRIAFRIGSSTTTTLVRTAVEALLDTVIPYYVLTRSVRSLPDLRYVVGHFAVGLFFAAGIAVVECLLQHNLYSGLQSVYDQRWQLTYQLARGGFIRVQAMTQQPILLAAAMLFLCGMWVWLKGAEWRQKGTLATFVMIFIALLGTGSRGPWLACGVLFLLLLMLRRLQPGTVRILLVCAVVAVIAGKALGADDAVLSALSAVFGRSSEEMSSIDYRRQLLDDSLALIRQSPWLGVPDYASKMQDLRQGEGIIDIVNTYVAIMLNAGIIGLALYLAPFVVVVHRMLGAIRRDEAGGISRGSRFAMVVVALVVAFLFMIFTSSTFGILQLLLLMLIALPEAWLRMSEQERESDPTPVVDDETRTRVAADYPRIRSRGA